ncbi:MAG: arsenate reductase (glutaredoxin) [Oligoflexia bacterium]|nr:arsenate reductase (glutaredoxin) [Oligoflexia bacterium]
MSKLKIYHNPRCSKSRATLEIIESKKAPVEIVNYLETPPSAAELDSLLRLLRLEPEQIVRKGEDRYEELGLEACPPKTRAEWIDVLVKNPILIERPIVTDGRRAVLGRPPENVQALLG